MNKQVIFIGLLVGSVIFLSMIFKGLISEEGKSKLMNSWEVEKILIGGEEVTESFKLRSLTFFDDERTNFVLVPFKIGVSMGDDKNANWRYKRTGFFDGVVEIYKTQQGIFDGVYEIEVLDHRKPNVVRLYSDKIEMICVEEGIMSPMGPIYKD